ncbi:MAG: hypothetical protein R3A10_15310 [Caldilineaceae bacterium]
MVLGDDGVIHGVKEALPVDCSTISPKVTQEIAAHAGREGRTCSTPPSAAAARARQRHPEHHVAAMQSSSRASARFEAMGKTITHVGGAGGGQTVKLVNQVLFRQLAWPWAKC